MNFQIMKFHAPIAVAALLLASGCSNAAQKEAEREAKALENQADAVRADTDLQAEALEDRADSLDTHIDGTDAAGERALEEKADRVRDSGERKADSLENQADAVRDRAKDK